MTRKDIQQQAVYHWVESNKKGTLELAVGTGKTIASLMCLYTMPQKDGKVHLFLAETVEREKDLLSDIQLFNKIYNCNVLQDYNIKFLCYQSAYRLTDYNFGLVIADEIHNSLTEEYIKFYRNNQYDAIVGLSATVDRTIKYEIDGEEVTKGDLMDSIAPSCYKYTMEDSIKDGIGRILNIYIITHKLDSKTKNIPAGSVQKRFFQTEEESYKYWDKEHKKSWFLLNQEMKDMKIRVTAAKRSKLLFELPSKVEATTKLLKNITGKSIIFANSLDSLLKVTPNVVSARNTPAENKTIRDNFDNNKISIIGSFKKLQQGANMKELDNCILMSYYSSEVSLVQRLGRVRKNGDKVGSAFIFLTEGTQEEVWASKMLQNLNDFNIIYCKDIDDCINKYSKFDK